MHRLPYSQVHLQMESFWKEASSLQEYAWLNMELDEKSAEEMHQKMIAYLEVSGWTVEDYLRQMFGFSNREDN